MSQFSLPLKLPPNFCCFLRSKIVTGFFKIVIICWQVFLWRRLWKLPMWELAFQLDFYNSLMAWWNIRFVPTSVFFSAKLIIKHSWLYSMLKFTFSDLKMQNFWLFWRIFARQTRNLDFDLVDQFMTFWYAFFSHIALPLFTTLLTVLLHFTQIR